MNRNQLKDIAAETISIIDNKKYKVNNVLYDISLELEDSIKNTKVYSLNGEIGERVTPLYYEKSAHTCKVRVILDDTVSAMRSQVIRYGSSCGLNFASAKNPGGGFLNGSMAQEEALSYATTLYGSIGLQKDLYEYSRNHLNYNLYTTWAIYSPNVCIIRDNSMRLSKYYRCGIISSPAPNAGAYKGNKKDLNSVLYERCKLILDVAIKNGEKNLVLGAFGCGVFRNSPYTVSETFYNLLYKDGYLEYFNNIDFAILGDKTDKNYKAFAERFK